MDKAGSPGSDRLSLKPPAWLLVSTAVSLLLAAASILLALQFSDRIDGTVRVIEESNTLAGWRNEAAIQSTIARDEDIPRYRSGRAAAYVAGGLFLAAFAVFVWIRAADRKRKTELLARMASDWKEEKSSEIRGFISLHIGTLAQKRSELMVSNAYGVVDESAWQQELVYFINRVLRQHCRVDADAFPFIELKAMIEKQVSMLG